MKNNRDNNSDPAPRKVIGQSIFFYGLADDIIDQLVELAISKQYKAGQLIFQRGEKAPGFYILVAGAVRVFLADPSGREQTLKIFQPGEIFGEAAVFKTGYYPASATATDDCTVLMLPTNRFKNLLSTNPDLSFAIIGILSQRLTHLADLLELGLKEILPRLASYLLEQANDEGCIKLTGTKIQLAASLNTTAESLSRTLGRLKQAHIIDELKPNIIILNMERLKAVAENTEEL